MNIEIIEIIEEDEFKGQKTNEVEFCENLGCAFNIDKLCRATDSECFGYLEPLGSDE